MTDVSRVAPNFLFLTGAQAVGFLCGLGTTVLLARALGPEGYGVLGFGQAFVGFAVLAVVMGTDSFGAREISRNRVGAGRLVSEIVGVRLLLAGVAFPVTVAAAYSVGLPDRTANVIALQAFGILAAVVSLDFVCQGLQRMGLIAVRQSAAALLVFTGAALLVGGPEDVYVAALLPAVAIAGTSFWLLLRLRSLLGGVGVSVSAAAGRRIMTVAVPIGLGGLSIGVFQYTDILMLGFHVPDAEVGRYVAMGRLYIIVVTAGNLLAAAFAPVLSQMGGDGTAEKRRRFRQFILAVLLFGGPPAATIAVFPDAALHVLFGPGFTADSGVLTIVMMSAVVFLVSIATSTVMVAWDDERFHVKTLAGSAVLNAALNAVLIPVWGLSGAALATLAGVVCLAGLELRRLSRNSGVAALPALLHCLGLLAASFGAALLAKTLLDAPVLDRSPVLVLIGFGGAASCLFAGAAAATGLVRPMQLVALLFRRAAS